MESQHRKCLSGFSRKMSKEKCVIQTNCKQAVLVEANDFEQSEGRERYASYYSTNEAVCVASHYIPKLLSCIAVNFVSYVRIRGRHNCRQIGEESGALLLRACNSTLGQSRSPGHS
jgi:hypothetical protein